MTRDDRSSTGPTPPNPFAALRAKLGGQLPPGPEPQAQAAETKAHVTAVERVSLRRERTGRGGKTVTVVEGKGLEGQDLAALAREAARALGLGARVEDGVLVVQGDPRQRLAAWLEARGFGRVECSN